MNAVLEREEAALFFRLWIPLLDYVNQRREIFPDLGRIERPTDIDIESAFEISEILWQEPELINEFLMDTELSDEDRERISEWKKFVSGRFVIERHLKKGAIFISVETGRVFLVKGINSSLEEPFPKTDLPVIVETALLPFNGKIMYCGLINRRCFLGRNSASDFKELYASAKENGRIITSL